MSEDHVDLVRLARAFLADFEANDRTRNGSEQERLSSNARNLRDANIEAPTGGFPRQLFQNRIPPIEFMCAICLEVARDATRCSLEHLFCRECIEHWIVTRGNGKCPLGNEDLKSSDLSPFRLPRNMIDEYDICCTTTAGRCKSPEYFQFILNLRFILYISAAFVSASVECVPCSWQGKVI